MVRLSAKRFYAISLILPGNANITTYSDLHLRQMTVSSVDCQPTAGIANDFATFVNMQNVTTDTLFGHRWFG